MTTTAEGPNHELFVKVLAQIEREPQRWDQTVWRNSQAECGTACCFAGWAATIDGRTSWLVDPKGNWDDYLSATEDEIVSGLAEDLMPIERFRGIKVIAASERAEQALGVSGNRATVLFAPNNTLDDLYRISADILGIDEQVLRDKVAAEMSA